MIKAIIFDFDGLIIDTEYAWYESFCEVLGKTDRDIPVAEYGTYIGTDGPAIFHFLLEKSGVNISIDDLREKARALHTSKLGTPVAREGVEDFLQAAKERGLKIGLASSSDRKWVTHFLEELHLLPYFDVIQTKDDVEKVKPDPALYNNVIQHFNILPSEAIAFEDSPNGTKAAIAAGLNCVIVPNRVTKSSQFENYHFRISGMHESSLDEIIEMIEGIV
ncbi:HAD family hydrolase [Sutcliffiella sp. NC1]|uniref:HAD family hydrolase n=1 Tax=Sutcliffiella sp. NC1 TaxID=3004096 RepID=UPI0022DE46F4|nr:HAD family hydrolase [Sutcliffiella sp. NC1]WBL16917.1 HAD family hydrolase [Sutcliffiella sp. NC1]